MIDRSNPCDERRGIPEAMLGIEHDGSKALARDCFGDDGGAKHAPSAEDRFASA
jgi:hypothetical protein